MQALEYEGDLHHVALVGATAGLCIDSKAAQTGPGIRGRPSSCRALGSKALSAPCTNIARVEVEDLGGAVSGEQRSLYRSGVMRLSYMAADMPDLQFVVRWIARAMNKPQEVH